MRALTLILPCFLLLSCYGRRGGSECVDNGSCTSDGVELQACIDGDCDEVECLSSADCGVGTYCDVEDQDADPVDIDYECKEGCLTEGDCLSGQTCDDGSCIERACRSTILDCEFGEVCDADSGECVAAEGLYCTGCTTEGHVVDDQGTPTQCDDRIVGHSACGDGALCVSDGDHNVCMPPCTSASDCPAGFSCQSFLMNTPAICGDTQVVLDPVCVPNQPCPD
jgi:hypothetical protein